MRNLIKIQELFSFSPTCSGWTDGLITWGSCNLCLKWWFHPPTSKPKCLYNNDKKLFGCSVVVTSTSFFSRPGGYIVMWFCVQKQQTTTEAGLVKYLCQYMKCCTFAQKPLLNANAGVSSGLEVLLLVWVFIYILFVHASSEDYGESAHMRRLTRTSVAGQCDR